MENKEYLALELTKLTGKTNVQSIFNTFSYFLNELNSIKKVQEQESQIEEYEKIISKLRDELKASCEKNIGLSKSHCNQLIDIINDNGINMEPFVKENLIHFIKHNM